jgi:hypothetical protein
MSSTASLEALRVAQAELCSGNTKGSVYVQLSPGAVMLQTDRVVIVEKVSIEILRAIQRDENGIHKASESRKT